MITSITLRPMPSAQLAEAVQLYESAFPKEERRPTSAWLALRGEEARFTMAAIWADGAWAGLATYWHLQQAVYVEHFAVCASLRGAGVGGAVLEQLKAVAAQAGRPLVLEIEPPATSEAAARRWAFYARHGMQLLRSDYVQPSYQPGALSPLPLWLLTSADVADADALVAELKAVVYGVQA